MLEMAFYTENANKRKEWIESYDSEKVLDFNGKIITVYDYIDRGLL